MERISGPYRGYYIAAYTVGHGGLYTGYAKVSADVPASVWSVARVERLVTVTGFRNDLEAISAAERGAREAIVDMIGSSDPVTTPGELR